MSENFADSAAAIHGVDLAAAGLSGFGRPDGYLERKLARWRQWELLDGDMPGYAELTTRLAADLPAAVAAAGPGTLVHGDYRLEHVLLRQAPGRRSRPCWTGRCPLWATHWPISAWPSTWAEQDDPSPMN